MAEKKETIIIELDFDISDLTKDAAKTTKVINDLNASQKKLKKNGEENSIQFQKNSQALKTNKKELAETNKTITNLTKANKSNAGSNEQLKAQLSILTAQYNKMGKAERETSEKGKALNSQIKTLSSTLKKNESDIGNSTRKVGEYENANKGLAGSFAGVDQATGGFLSKLKLLLANPIVLIITGFVAVLALLKKAFTSSEEGENKLAKGMAILGSVFDNFLDVIANVAEYLVAAFENPKQALEDFAGLIKKNIINRFEGLLELIPQLGKAIGQLFSGNFAEAGKIATNAVAKVTLGVDDLTGKLQEAGEAIKKFGQEVSKDASDAAAVADKRAKADIIERKLLVERARLEGEIANLRLKAKKEDSVSAEERKKALLEARDLEDSLLVKEQQVLKLRFEAQKQENTFAKSNKENKNKEAELEAQLLRNVTTRANAARTIQRELNTVNAQVRTAEKKRAKEAISDADKELKLFISNSETKITVNQFLTDELVKQEKERLDLIAVEQKKFQERRLEAGIIDQTKYNEEINKVDQDNRLANEQLAIDRKAAQQEAEILDIANQREIDLVNRESEFELLKQDLARQKNQEIEEAKKTGANIGLIEAKHAAYSKDLNKQKFNAQLSDASNTFGAIGVLLHGNSDLEKAAAIASATINAYQSITAVLAAKSTIPEPFGSVAKGLQATAIGATAFRSVQKMTATSVPKAEKGMVLNGNPHSRGGVELSADGVPFAEAERGELLTIVNAKNTAMLSSLSGLNEYGGNGVPFFAQGGTQSLDGGASLRNISGSIQGSADEASQLIDIISNQPNPVVFVQEINEKQSEVNEVEIRAIT